MKGKKEASQTLMKKEGRMTPMSMMPMMQWGWDPFREFSRIRDTMNEMFNDLFRGMIPSSMISSPMMARVEGPPSLMSEMGFPMIDMYEKGDNLIVEAAVPGMKKEDVTVHVTPNSITISGESKSEEEKEEGEVYRKEISFGSFSRTMSLPTEIKQDKIKANFKDGILKITLPMKEPSKTKKVKVEIE